MVPLTCVGLMTMAMPALAQYSADSEALEPSSPSAPAGQLQFGAGFGYRADADIDKGGKSSEVAVRTTASGHYSLNDQFRLGMLMSYQHSYYDFSGSGRPDNGVDVNLFRVTPLLQYTVDENWSVYGGPSFSYAGENGAEFGDSLTGGGLAGFNYRVDETLTLGAGFGIFSQIEDDVSVVPLVTLNWQFDEKWNWKIGFSEVAANGGLGTEIAYSLGKDWKVGGGVQFTKKRFRLSNDGVAEDKNVPIYAKLAWQACENGSLELVAGITAGGQYRVENSNGHKLYESDYDASALVGLRGVFKF